MSNAATAEIVQHQAPAIVPSNVITPMALIDRAIEKGSPVEVIGQMMDFQERYDRNNARKAFDAAIAAAKAHMPVILKNATGHNSKKYANFAAIATAVDPVISEHGLSYRFRTTQTEKSISVTCVLSHRDGHSEETTLSGPADASGSKNAIQAIGSTLTYLQRYSLVQMLGLAASEDDDGKAGAGIATITQEQADDIRDLLESAGKDKAKFLKWAKIERIEDLRADFYQSSIDAIKAAKQ